MIEKNWLLGFVEANGCFSIILKKSTNAIGYQAIADFSIKLPKQEEVVLKEIQRSFKAGRIYNVKNEAVLKATGIDDVKRIAGMLKPMRFVSARKRKQFDSWSKCIEIIESGGHLERNGLLEIAILRDRLHEKRHWNKKMFCYIRLDVDPCHVYKNEGNIPQTCQICFDNFDSKQKIDIPIDYFQKTKGDLSGKR